MITGSEYLRVLPRPDLSFNKGGLMIIDIFWETQIPILRHADTVWKETIVNNSATIQRTKPASLLGFNYITTEIWTRFTT